MSARAQRIVAVLIVLATSSGCGLDDLGVTAISFPLVPVLAGALPDEYDRTAAALASGSMDVDVPSDHAHLSAAGLPVPPLGYDYAAMVTVATDERLALPMSSPSSINTETTGHSHGALTANGPADTATESVHLGLLVPQGGGRWSLAVSSAEMGGKPLGAIRSAMVMLVPTMGAMPGMPMGNVVLAGDAANAAPGTTPAGHGGHTHGV